MNNEHDPLAPFRRKEPQSVSIDQAEQAPTPGEKVAARFRDQVNNPEGGWGEELAEMIDAAIAKEKAILQSENGRLEAITVELPEAVKPQIVRLLETFKEFINDAEKEHAVNYWATKAEIDQVLNRIDQERAQENPARTDATGDRAQWENIKQLAINAFANITWEQAQEYIRYAYDDASEVAEAIENDLNPAENAFVQNMNQSILEENEAYSSAIKEMFRDRLSRDPFFSKSAAQQEPQPEPQSSTPEKERDIDLEPNL